MENNKGLSDIFKWLWGKITGNSTPQPTEPIPEPIPEPEPEPEEEYEDGDMANTNKRSIHFGLNDYKGSKNDLRGCVPDAKNWRETLKAKGFSSIFLKDSNVTKTNFVSNIKKLIALSKDGDWLVITFSGHGTHIKDENGDEADGRDEALCLYDSIITDDELRTIFKTIPNGVKTLFVSDSCHSASMTRAALDTLYSDEYIRPRYMPPETNDIALLNSIKVKKPFMIPEEGMNHILLSGCQANESSYDTVFNGQACGALSYYANKIIRERGSMTFSQLHGWIRQELPSTRYPQQPSLEGPHKLKNSVMFE